MEDGGRVAVGWIRSGRERDCGKERWRMGWVGSGQGERGTVVKRDGG